MSMSTIQSIHTQHPMKRRRLRVPKSCLPCRQRKLKCNRQSPCSSCVTFRTADRCLYADLQSVLQSKRKNDRDTSNDEDFQPAFSIETPSTFAVEPALRNLNAVSVSRIPPDRHPASVKAPPVGYDPVSDRLPIVASTPVSSIPSDTRSTTSSAASVLPSGSYPGQTSLNPPGHPVAASAHVPIPGMISGMSSGSSSFVSEGASNGDKNSIPSFYNVTQDDSNSSNSAFDEKFPLSPLRKSPDVAYSTNGYNYESGHENGQVPQQPILSLQERISALQRSIAGTRCLNKTTCDELASGKGLATPTICYSENSVRFFSPCNAKFRQYSYLQAANRLRKELNLSPLQAEKLHKPAREFYSSSEHKLAESTIEDIVHGLQTVTWGTREAVIQWRRVLNLLPPRAVCDFLVERYLNTINTLLYATTSTHLAHIVQEVWTLRYRGFMNERIEKVECQRVAVLLMVCLIGRSTLPADWSPRTLLTIDDSSIDRVYLGEHLRKICIAVVDDVDINTESNLTFLQLLLLINAYNMYPNGHGNGFGAAQCAQWTARAIRCATVMGLHRDPTSYGAENPVPPHHVRFWRSLWRQCVIVDTVMAFDMSLPPMINLKYSDTRLLEDDFEEGADCDKLGRLFTNMLIQWAELCRFTLDNLLMAPKYDLNNDLVSITVSKFFAFRGAFLKPLESLKPGPNMTLRDEHLCNMQLCAHILTERLKVASLEVCGSRMGIMETAIQCIEIQKMGIENLKYLPSFATWFQALSLQVNTVPFMTILYFILGYINNEPMVGAFEPPATGGHKINVKATLDSMASVLSWVGERSQTSFVAWKNYLVMRPAFLDVLQIVQAVIPDIPAYNFKPLAPPEDSWWYWLTAM